MIISRLLRVYIMMIFETSCGDRLHFYRKSLVLLFAGMRNTLSTSPLNGGYNQTLNAVFNNDCKMGAGMGCEIKAETYKEHLELLSIELGLDPQQCSGIGTAASMENVSIKTKTYGELNVTAIVTGGIETNGGRVGDPASWDEWANSHKKMSHGTINIILCVDANIPAGTLTRALVTVTEAKTAAIQELMAGSNYSNDLATGSGTDSTIIVGNLESPMTLTDAGKHSKLGEIIGVTVKEAVREALFKETGLSPKSQHNSLARLKRYGVSCDSLWKQYLSDKGNLMSKPDFIHAVETLGEDNKVVAPISAVIHMVDQYRWKLLNAEETLSASELILSALSISLGIQLPSLVPESVNGNLVDVIIKRITQLLILRIKS